MAKSSAHDRISALIASGIPRTLAILQVYGKRGKLSKKYKGISISGLKVNHRKPSRKGR